MKHHLAGAAAVVAAITTLTQAATTITYEEAVLGGTGYLNDARYAAAGVTHSNTFTDWGGGFTSWDGFAISNHTDTATAGYGNQYSSYSGGGAGGSGQYAVSYCGTPTSSSLVFLAATNMAGLGASFNNTTYAALSMLNGDAYSKKFGGASGTDEDWFKLTITGMNGGSTTAAIDFLLADYRGSADTIVSDWTLIDFTPLGTVDKIVFTLSSTDNTDYGFGPSMNTPAYFAMDNLVVPEPSSIALLLAAGLMSLRRKRTT